MIYYDGSYGLGYLRMLCQTKGSVFPKALKVALPCSAIAAGIRMLMGEEATLLKDIVLLSNNGAWSGFSFLVGFLIVFRTSQAYNRFWEGCSWTHRMRGDWYNASSAICSFCILSQADEIEVMHFKMLFIRLISLLHATALADIEDCNRDSIDNVKAFSLPLIDVESLDPDSLLTLKTTGCKVELLFAWIQQLITKNTTTGLLSVPPPILSRAYQELGNGMVAFHHAVKIATVPFPFPYAQTCEWLLVLHFCVAPLVMAQWTSSPVWAAIFTFVQVFVLWALDFIACEIENPFGSDENDLDYEPMQMELNRQLLMLTSKSAITLPSLLTEKLSSDDIWNAEVPIEWSTSRSTLLSAWRSLDQDESQTAHRTDKRRHLRRQKSHVEDVFSRAESGPKGIVASGDGVRQLRLTADAKPPRSRATRSSTVDVAGKTEGQVGKGKKLKNQPPAGTDADAFNRSATDPTSELTSLDKEGCMDLLRGRSATSERPIEEMAPTQNTFDTKISKADNPGLCGTSSPPPRTGRATISGLLLEHARNEKATNHELVMEASAGIFDFADVELGGEDSLHLATGHPYPSKSSHGGVDEPWVAS